MLFLMRHGQRADNVMHENPAETLEKIEDPHLTQRGKLQAFAAGQKIEELIEPRGIKKIKVVSSPFIRCLQTAQEVCRKLGVKQIQVDLGLSETLHTSFYKENPMDKIIFRDPTHYKKYVDIPLILLEKPGPAYPQNFPTAAERYISTFAQFEKATKHGECCILVSHGYSINFVLEQRSCFDAFLGVDYCCLNAFQNGEIILQQHHEKI